MNAPMSNVNLFELLPNTKAVAGAIRKRRLRLADIRALKSLLKKAAVLAVVLALVFGFVFGVAPMKGSDMEPKISAGDILVFYRLETSYARNDVVYMERQGSQYVARVIGMPGDTVEITSENTVVINGAEIIETNIFFETPAFQQAVQYPLTLKQGEYFLLGDARETAKDSRYFGVVKSEELKGNLLTVIHRNSV